MDNYFKKVGDLSSEEKRGIKMNKTKNIMAKIVSLSLATIVGYYIPHDKVGENRGNIESVNQVEHDPQAVANFCNTLIAYRNYEIQNNLDTRWDSISARNSYITKLSEIIASLQGDNYSQKAYTVARAEYHKAVEEYTE